MWYWEISVFNTLGKHLPSLSSQTPPFHQVKLSREEGHVEALEQQLGTLDNTREQLEKKLQNVYASLRTVTRMYQDITPASPSLRSRKGTKIGWYRAGQCCRCIPEAQLCVVQKERERWTIDCSNRAL